MLKTMFCGLAASLALSAVAVAAPPPEGKGGRLDGMFDRLDANGDGYLTDSEIATRHKRLFDDADADRDGKISRDEMRGHLQKKHDEKRANRFPDANGDGAVTRQEFEAASRERFDDLDADKNGKLTEEEVRRGHPH